MKENKDKKLFEIRPPVVVVLGHVDHGKSSLLEAIKDLKITAKESGGITQHIGAYQVEQEGKKITFIDTPGHEAFEAMRSRGAKTADIAILVIAAEESIKPQTKEAIKHIKEAKIPMIVAINKVDKSEADPERIKRELMIENIIVESMGGDTPSVNTSATTKKGVPELLEMILLVAEMEELKSDETKEASGIVIESYLDPKKGPIATLILREGKLKEGDIIGTDSTTGKIKNLEDFQGNSIKEALPSDPVIALGLDQVPGAGEGFRIFNNIEKAREELQERKAIFESIQVGERAVLNLILKVDVLGSMEAIEKVLSDIPQEKVVINVLKDEVGEINNSDISLAKTSGAIIIGFRVKTDPIAKKLAEREKIKIIVFEVIYELAQVVREALERKLSPEIIRNDLGKFKVLAIFKTDKKQQIVGGKVIGGELKRGVSLDVFRAEEKIGEGRIVKLKKEKEDIESVAKGRECGILYEGNVQLEEDDILEAFTKEKQKSTL